MNDSGESRKDTADRKMEVLSAKCKTRIGFWNVRTVYETGKLAQATAEMGRYTSLEVVRADGQVQADTKSTQERQCYIPEEKTISTMREKPSSSRKVSRSA